MCSYGIKASFITLSFLIFLLWIYNVSFFIYRVHFSLRSEAPYLALLRKKNLENLGTHTWMLIR